MRFAGDFMEFEELIPKLLQVLENQDLQVFCITLEKFPCWNLRKYLSYSKGCKSGNFHFPENQLTSSQPLSPASLTIFFMDSPRSPRRTQMKLTNKQPFAARRDAMRSPSRRRYVVAAQL